MSFQVNLIVLNKIKLKHGCISGSKKITEKEWRRKDKGKK